MSRSRQPSAGQFVKLNSKASSFRSISPRNLVPLSSCTESSCELSGFNTKSRTEVGSATTRLPKPITSRKVQESLFGTPMKSLRQKKSSFDISVNNSTKAFTPSPAKNHRLLARQGSALSSKFPVLATVDTTLSLSVIAPVKDGPISSPRIKLSPLGPQEQQATEEKKEPKFSPEEIKEKLYRIFQFYTSFGERSNLGYLKSHRFHKMMVDGEVRDEWMNQISLDLLFVGELRHNGNLDFERFQSLLTRIARVKYDGEIEDDTEAFNMIIEKHMVPLYDRLFKFVDNEEETRVHEVMEDATRIVLSHVEPTLEKIYKAYFPIDIQTGEMHITRQKMENALFIFLRDFNICPDLINKGTAYAIWSEILRSEDDTNEQNQNGGNEQGKDNKLNDKNLPLTMEKFKLFLMRVSNLGYPQDQAANPDNIFAEPGQNGQMWQPGQLGGFLSQPERTAQLLERMDIALRNLSPEKKALLPIGGKATLLVAPDALTKIMEEVETQRLHRKKLAARYVIKTRTDYAKYNITDKELIALFEEHHGALVKIFQYYASFGEPLNNTKLHAFKFLRLLREAGLLQVTDANEPSFKVLPGASAAREGMNNTGILRVEADIIVAYVAGPKQVRESNEKKLTYDPRIATPFLGFLSHLYQNDPLELAAQGRLEFGAFLKAIDMVANKLYPKKNSAKGCQILLEKNILLLEKEIVQIEKMSSSMPLKALVDLLADIQMVQFLGLIHKAIGEYYKSYANSKGLMNIEKFMQFCRDFYIFPDLVKKFSLQTIFKALANVRADTEETKAIQAKPIAFEKRRTSQPLTKTSQSDDDEELIDQHMFVEALVLCALDIPYLNPQPTEMQKIYNLLEKLNRSQGPVIVRMRLGLKRAVSGLSWDLVHEIRGKYPELWMQRKEEMPTEERLNTYMDERRIMTEN